MILSNCYYYTLVRQKPQQLDGLSVGRGYGIRRRRRGTTAHGAGSSAASRNGGSTTSRPSSSLVTSVRTHHSALVTRPSRIVVCKQPARDLHTPREIFHPYYPHSRVTSVVFLFLEFPFTRRADGRRRFIFNYNIIINIPTNVLLFFVNRNKHSRYFTVLQHWSRQRHIRPKNKNFIYTSGKLAVSCSRIVTWPDLRHCQA